MKKNWTSDAKVTIQAKNAFKKKTPNIYKGKSLKITYTF